MNGFLIYLAVTKSNSFLIQNLIVMNPIYKFKNYSGLSRVTFSIILLVMFPVLMLQAQKIQPRLNYGARLEPKGKIINGAGQDLAAYKNYWNVMHTQNKPLMYMTYFNLRDLTSDWSVGLKSDMMSNPGKFQVAQIGLSMTTDGTPSSHYEQDVASGVYDAQINTFIDGLQSLAMPAYIRIGYEFNGTAWNGYVASTYKAAFIHITNLIRLRGVEAATVWDLAMDGVMNYMDFYPGDAYVDWWGINLFSASHFTDPNAKKFLDSADVHKRPVMIGETTPRFIGVLNGQTSWNNWFSPFFTFIHANPGIKAFSYINWNWSSYPQWSDWGDARLESNTLVGNAFANEMDSTKYLHASSEQDFRKTFGLPDNTPPAKPGTISVVQSGYPLLLNWNAVTDPSGLSHYIIYKHGVLSDYTLTLPYADNSIAAGDTITYAVSAMDRAGNESPKTAGLKVNIPSSLSRVLNGEFDDGTRNWTLSNFVSNVSSTMIIDPGSVISGSKSCAITLSQVSGTDWHTQLWQWLPIRAGRTYTITFKAKASGTKVIGVAVQKGASPYTTYLYKNHALTTSIQTFTDVVTDNATDEAKLEFYLSSAGAVKIWIDAVTITETVLGTTSIKEIGSESPLILNYPNPFKSVTTIEYSVKKLGFVSLKIFDMLGKEIAVLVNEKKPVGNYLVDWNASGLPDGIYFCRLQTGSFVEVKKMQFIK